MKPAKKPKYPIDIKKISIESITKKEKDLTAEELYREILHSKIRLKRRR